MRVVALYSVLLLSCAPEVKPLVSCVTNAVPVFFGPPAPIAWPGQRAELPIEWVPPTICSDGSGETVHGVVVELFDPDNRLVSASATTPVRRVDAQNTRWESTVSFEATRLGPHHLIATFVPEGGLIQGDIWVVEDRRDAGFIEEYTAGTSCDHLERTVPGPLLCQNTGGAFLFRPNALPTRWPGALARTAGDVLWMTVPPNLLSRVVQRPDGGLETSTLTATVSTSLAAVNEDEVIVWAGESIRWIGFDAGFWSDLWRVEALEPYRGAVAVSADAGTVVISSLSQWRRVDLRGPPPLDAGWTPGSTLHQARDGIWTRPSSGDALRFIPADARQPTIEFATPPRWQSPSGNGIDALQPGDLPFLVPLRLTPPYTVIPDRSQALVPRLTDAGVEYLHFVAPAGALFQEVTGPWLRAIKGDNHYFFRLDPG